MKVLRTPCWSVLSGIVLVLPSPSHAALSVLHLATCSRSARVLHAYYLPTRRRRRGGGIPRRHAAQPLSIARRLTSSKEVTLVLKTKTICDFPSSMGKPILMKSPYTKLSQYPLCKACLSSTMSLPKASLPGATTRRPWRRQHHFVDQHRARGRSHCSYPEDICRKGGRERADD